MNFIKRITATVSSQLEGAVDRMENHEAIVAANIKQSRAAIAKTKARLNTLHKQLNSYQQQLDQHQQERAKWVQRATEQAEHNQQVALQCIARYKQCDRDIARCKQAMPQQQQLIDSVTGHLQTLEEKHIQLSQQHDLMRSRETVAHINRDISKLDQQDITDTLERWESRIIEAEITETEASAVVGMGDNLQDPLEATFSQQEHQAELMAELEILMATKNHSKEPPISQ